MRHFLLLLLASSTCIAQQAGTFVRWDKASVPGWARVYLKAKDGKEIACDDGFTSELPAYAKGDAIEYSLSQSAYIYPDGSRHEGKFLTCQIRKPDSTLTACAKLPKAKQSDCIENWRQAGNNP